MPIAVDGEDLPAFAEPGQYAAIVLPRAGLAVDQQERVAVRRAFGIVDHRAVRQPGLLFEDARVQRGLVVALPVVRAAVDIDGRRDQEGGQQREHDEQHNFSLSALRLCRHFRIPP